MAEVLGDGVVKTRKDHKCHGCLEIIPKGTRVYSQTVVNDRIDTIYICDKCINWCKNKKCNDCVERESAYEGYIGECMREWRG